ncbi:MAG: folate family ECF transporter S component [Oscillospiraceae bacterium]|nr:folate family ECF transporter S component [Oscillospiraceae bacterium]
MFKSTDRKNMVRWISLAGLMIAMGVVVGCLSFFPMISKKISFGFLVSGAAGYILGPAAAVCGALVDIIGCWLHPKGPYFWGFTVTAALGNLIYGVGFHSKKVSFLRCLVVCLVVIVFCNLCLNTLWILHISHAQPKVLLLQRLLWSAVDLVLHPTLLTVVLKKLEELQKARPWF